MGVQNAWPVLPLRRVPNSLEPGRARVFGGWAANGSELSREVWRLPPSVCRPVPRRSSEVSHTQVRPLAISPARDPQTWSQPKSGAEPAHVRGNDATPWVSRLLSAAWSSFSAALGLSRDPCVSGPPKPGRSRPPDAHT